MLSVILGAIFAGMVVAIVAKLGTAHRSPGAFIFAALIGGLGGLLGLFGARMIGVSREDEPTTFVVCAVTGLLATLVYAGISRILVRSARSHGRHSRPSTAF
ncbi:MAG: hypothetical protein HYV09_01925 [Deltaproteobacteria bacterium]|nr:hypothetical protein [Deltaproteobacteria bacterium]